MRLTLLIVKAALPQRSSRTYFLQNGSRRRLQTVPGNIDLVYECWPDAHIRSRERDSPTSSEGEEVRARPGAVSFSANKRELAGTLEALKAVYPYAQAHDLSSVQRVV